MKLIAYYEGGKPTELWLNTVLGRTDIVYYKLPSKNISNDFTKLPAYVADILNLDKPDIIISGSLDGEHERPIFSIEFASCTPQYQHALQRFSRMMASVVNGCPSAIIIPSSKRENSAGKRLYKRSQAIDYGAVKLMDIYGTPAFVFDWEDKDGILQMEGGTNLPPIASSSVQQLKTLLIKAIEQFNNVDYIKALWKLPITRELLDETRTRAYSGNPPSISKPGGGEGGPSKSNLKLIKTADLVKDLESRSPAHKAQIKKISGFINDRDFSLVFYPTRFTAHAGDPYVGMIGYYDIAFCRVGKTTRDREYNLIAYCKDVSIDELNSSMIRFNAQGCPFTKEVSTSKLQTYSYHLKYGCKLTKSKPIRIYAELADIIIFKDGIIYNVG